jgi:serine/threonine protein kinase
MEYVPGKSLDVLLEKFGAFHEKMIRSYTKQLLLALAYCHKNRVVHRDIKGKNILVDTKGRLKLADFGSAKKFSSMSRLFLLSVLLSLLLLSLPNPSSLLFQTC